MRFDRTKGLKAKYIVTLYGWNVDDRYYCHYFRDAKAIFESIKAKGLEKGSATSIYDLEKDERKAFAKG